MNEMFITPIRPMEFGKPGEMQKIGKTTGIDTFKGVFENAIGNVRTTEEDLVNKQYLLATGQIEDAHSVGIAASQAQLSLDMLVSLRNKALEAYNEIMRVNL